jgi:hypothetical protein
MPPLTPDELARAASGLDVAQLLAYCASLADEFESRRNRVRNYVKHNLTSGTANEEILRSFLATIAASRYGVTEGFVCNPIRGEASKQCDILVHNRDFPLVYAEGNVVIVWPASVLMSIEVKTTMSGVGDLLGAVENIASVRRLDSARPVIGIVFAFDSLLPKTALDALQTLNPDRVHRPAAVLLFQQGAILHLSNVNDVLRFGDADGEYELRRCVGENPSAVVLTYMLLLFLRAQFMRIGGETGLSDLWMATERLIADNTVAE